MPSVGLLAAGVAHELNSPLTGILTFAHVLAKRMPDNSQEQQHPFDVVLVNLRMPELDGLAFSRQLKDFQPDTEVMVMTGFAEISTAVEAIKLGAFDYVPKPFNPEQLVIVVAKRWKPERCGPKIVTSAANSRGAFTGATSAKKGLSEVASGGTLFLDEISNTSHLLQAKLLRVPQERVFIPVGDTRERTTDIRLIAATNKDIDAMVADGTFRQELYYRINIVPIALPALREWITARALP